MIVTIWILKSISSSQQKIGRIFTISKKTNNIEIIINDKSSLSNFKFKFLKFFVYDHIYIVYNDYGRIINYDKNHLNLQLTIITLKSFEFPDNEYNHMIMTH